MAEEMNIFSAKPVITDDDDDDQKDEGEEDEKEGAKEDEPTNIAQWISQMISLILNNMLEAQQWQASMTGREKQYVLLAQLFNTASELIQGPSRINQKLLLDANICCDISNLWKIVRIDEFAFRGLIQDNEDLADSWMDLLKVMREAEIAALMFLLSMLEEEPLDQDSEDYAEMQSQVIEHKTMTVKRMVEELSPKILGDKIITQWNLSAEVDDPIYDVEPFTEEDEKIDNDTADRVVRPKRECECDHYPEDDQKEHCLQISMLAYAVFNAIIYAPEMKTPLFKTMVIDRSDDEPGPFYSTSSWSTKKTKIFDRFVQKVEGDHDSKYLHFLVGRIEIIRGARLQRIFFLMPRTIRTLKKNPLIHEWQEETMNGDAIDRESPESQIDSFSDAVNEQYISFVEHQYSLLSKPAPFNMAGEVISLCIKITMVTTVIINSIMVYVYVGSYSRHPNDTELHYPSKFWVYIIKFFAGIHFTWSLVWFFFYTMSKSGWIMETGIEQWRQENPRESSKLQNPTFKYTLGAYQIVCDPQLQYNGFLLVCSFMGFNFNFLFNAVNTVDLCKNVPILRKVIEAIVSSMDQVVGTMILGFVLQYVFVAVSFMAFGKGYGFADMDTSGCATLVECLKGHFDYGFRSAPVWGDPKLDAGKFFFDYMYNLFIILIMASIISGIIIDQFSELQETMQMINEEMSSKCFICSFSQSELERQRVKFDKHILHDHYMWSYARFLLYLSSTDNSLLNGPESYVRKLISENNMGFFPIKRCIDIESSDMGEEHLEREVRVKDMEEVGRILNTVATNTEEIKRQEGNFKVELKDLRDSMAQTSLKVQQLQALLTVDDDQDKKKKKKKGG